MPEHRIGVRQPGSAGELYDRTTGARFVARGANYIRLAASVPGCPAHLPGYHTAFDLYEPARAEAALAALAADGDNVVRVFLNPKCLGEPGALTPAVVGNIADFVGRAKAHGIFVIMTTDGIPNGYYTIPAPQFEVVNYALLTAGGVTGERQFWQELIGELAARGAALDAVLAYAIRNEAYFLEDLPPLSFSSGTVTTANGRSYDMAVAADRQRMMDEGLVYYIDELRAGIRAVDPTALVTIGFFAPNSPNLWRPGDTRAIRTYPAIAGSTADFIDLHAYPDPVFTLDMHVENFEMAGLDDKPILMAETGAFKSVFASASAGATALQEWQVASCAHGFDGWLVWTWDTAEQPELWTAVDDGGVIAAALSPVRRPDPCVPGLFPGQNLARGKPATASATMAGSPASAAVDGNADTIWNAGDFPPQWIEVDLGAPTALSMVRLVVSQFPAGTTTHTLYGRNPGDPGSTLLHEWTGATADGDTLTHSPTVSWRFLRIETTASPSWVGWREIEALAR